MSKLRSDRNAVVARAVSHVVERLEARQLFAFQTSINFGIDNSAAAPGYHTDIGTAYRSQSNGLDYGWIDPSTGQPTSVTAYAYDRNSALAADQRYDTGLGTKPSAANRSWELSLPNGTYYVRLAAGDANVPSGTYRYNVEDTQNFLSGTATSSNRWIVAGGYVDVDDGKLTISNGTGAANYQIAFVEITDAPAKALDTVNAPTDVIAVPAAPTTIDVRWTDNADNEDGDVGFKIERRTGVNGTWSQVGTAFGNARLFTDNSVSGGITYSYRVRAINGINTSEYSNESQTTTPSSNAQAAYSNDGANWVLPGRTVQAEDFDRGGSNVAYLDSIAGNAGGFYRSGNVDTGAMIDGSNGYFVGWTRAGEWLEYTVDVPAGGTYYVDARVASEGLGGAFRVDFDGTNVTGSLQVPDTGSFRNYDLIRSGTFALAFGTHVMRVYATADNPTGYWVGDIDWFKVQRFDAPANLTAQVVNESAINLFWDKRSSDETGFRLQRSADGVTWSDLADLDANVVSFTDYGLDEATAYFYRVAALSEFGATPYSASMSATTLPASPTEFYTDAAGSSQIDLYWTDNSASETGFRIEQSSDGETWALLNDVPADTTTYSVTGLNASTQYFFRIRAFNATGVSVFTQSAAQTTAPGGTLPDTPGTLTAVAFTQTQVDLTWTDNTTAESGYRVERRDGAGGVWATLVTLGVDSASYSDTSAEAYHTYYYRVLPVNQWGDGDASNIVSATTGIIVPTALTATSNASGTVLLTWADNSNNEVGFRVFQYQTVDGQTVRTPLGEVAGNDGTGATEFTVNGLDADSEYAFTVQAYTEDVATAESAPVTITPTIQEISATGGNAAEYDQPYVLTLAKSHIDALLTWVVDWGDGSVPQTIVGPVEADGTILAEHTYAAPEDGGPSDYVIRTYAYSGDDRWYAEDVDVTAQVPQVGMRAFGRFDAPSSGDDIGKQRAILKVFSDVYSQVKYEPYAGVKKGGEATENTLRGNDWDQAALLQSLIAQIPGNISTEFQYRVVTVAADKVMKWLGVKDEKSAEHVLYRAGVLAGRAGAAWQTPDNFTDPTLSGSYAPDGLVYLWHAWLKVAVPGQSGTYWELDPSWKYRDFRAGVPNAGQQTFDETSFVNGKDAASTTRSLPKDDRQSPLEWYGSQLRGYIRSQAVTAGKTSLADLAYDGPIIAKQFTSVPTISEWGPSTDSTLHTGIKPDSISGRGDMRHRVRITLEARNASQTRVQVFSQPVWLSEVDAQPLVLQYRAVDDGSGHLGGWTPVLYQGDQPLWNASFVMTPSAEVWVTVETFGPGQIAGAISATPASQKQEFTRNAGEPIGFMLNAQQHSTHELLALQKQLNDEAVDKSPDYFVYQRRLLGLIAAKYARDLADATNATAAWTNTLAVLSGTTWGMVTGAPYTTLDHDYKYVKFAGDLQNPILFGRQSTSNTDINTSVTLDIGDRRAVLEPISTESNRNRLINAEQVLGLESSFLEHSVLQEVASALSVSTAKLFQKAAKDNASFVWIDSNNVSNIATLLNNVNDAVRAAVTQDVAAGFRCFVVNAQVNVQSWKGFTWKRINSATLSTDYLIMRKGESVAHGGAGSDPIESVGVPAEYQRSYAAIDGGSVNSFTGALYNKTVDVTIPKPGVPLTFARKYDSTLLVDRGLGRGWMHTYGDYLVLSRGSGAPTTDSENVAKVLWVTSDGERYDFNRASGGSKQYSSFESPSGLFGKLEYFGKDPNNHNKNYYRYTDKDGSYRLFDYQGRLKEIGDRKSNRILVTYQDSLTYKINYVYFMDPPQKVGSGSYTANGFSFGWGAGANPELQTLKEVTVRITSDKPPEVVQVPSKRQWTWVYGDKQSPGEKVTRMYSPGPKDGSVEQLSTAYRYYNDEGARDGLLKNVERYVNDQLTGVYTFDYYANKRVFSIMDPLGETNAQGDALDHAEFYSYDLFSKKYDGADRQTYTSSVSVVDKNGNETTTRYNDAGLPVRTLLPDGGRTDQQWYAYKEPKDADADPATGKYLPAVVENELGTVDGTIYNVFGDVDTRVTGSISPVSYVDQEHLNSSLKQLTGLIGHKVTFTYEDAYHQLRKQVDFGNIGKSIGARTVLENTYDTAGDLMYSQDAAGQFTLYHYNVNGLLDAKTLPQGARVVGNVGQTTSNLYKIQYVYTAGGQLRQELRQMTHSGPAVPVSYYEYDTDGHTTLEGHGELTPGTASPGNGGTSVVLTSDGKSSFVRSVYDVHGRLSQKIVDPQGKRLTTTYTWSDGKLMAVVQPGTDQMVASGASTATPVTHYTYDKLGRVTFASDVNAKYAGTNYEYDSAGNVVAQIDHLANDVGRKTVFVYDERNRKIQTVYADGSFARTLLDGGGRVTAATVPLNTVQDYRLDPVALTSTAFNADGTVQSVTDPAGQTTAYEYNRFYEQEREAFKPEGPTSQALRTTLMTRDSLGRVIEVRSDTGAISKTVYDANGNVTSVTQYEVSDYLNNAPPPGGQVSYMEKYSTPLERVRNIPLTYDPWYKTKESGPFPSRQIFTTTTDYNQFDQPTMVTDPTGARTQTEYDLLGRAVAVTDARGVASTTAVDYRATTTYDGAGRVVSRTLADTDSDSGNNPTLAFTYHPNGAVKTSVDANGDVTRYEYDLAKHATYVTNPMGGVRGTIKNALGEITSVTDEKRRTTSFEYDARGRVTKKTPPRPTKTTPGWVVKSAYDQAGHLVQTIDGGNRLQTEQTYDALGRVTHTTQRDLQTNQVLDETDQTYYANQPVVSTDARGFKSKYTYDNAGRAVGFLAAETPNTGPTTADRRWSRTYDSLGRKITDTAYASASGGDPRTTTYAYDKAGRLLQRIASEPSTGGRNTAKFSPTTNYRYDAVGNLVAEITPRGSALLAETKAGTVNESMAVSANIYTTTYQYDAQNRRTLVSAIDPTGSATGGRTAALSRASGSTTVTATLANHGFAVGDRVMLTGSMDNSLKGIYTVTSVPNAQTFTYVTAANTATTASKAFVATRVTTNTYDASGNLLTTIDALGRTTTTLYDDLNRATDVAEGGRTGSVSRPNGSTTVTVKLPNHGVAVGDRVLISGHMDNSLKGIYAVASVIDAQIFTYVTTASTAASDSNATVSVRVTSKSYDEVGNVLTVTDGLGRIDTTFYDDLDRATDTASGGRIGNLTRTSGSTTVTATQSDHGLSVGDRVMITGAIDNSFKGVYTVTSVSDAQTFTYTTAANTAASTTRAYVSQHVVSNTYDANGNVLSTIGGRGSVASQSSLFRTDSVYDALNRVVSQTGPDADGNAQTSDRPMTSTTYDAAGNVVSTTDPRGVVTTSEYDYAGRVTRTRVGTKLVSGITFSGTTATVTATAHGYNTGDYVVIDGATDAKYNGVFPIVRLDANRFTYTMTVAPSANASGTLRASASAVSSAYNFGGEKTSTRDAYGNTTTYGYDKLGRSTSVMLPDPDGTGSQTAPISSTTYDLDGNVRSRTNARGKATWVDYDDAGRKVRQTLPDADSNGATTGDSPVTSYAYDAGGNVVATTDPRGYVASVQYDALNRVIGIGSVERSATVSGSGTTITVSLTAHGFAIGDRVLVRRSATSALNTVMTVSAVSDANTFVVTAPVSVTSVSGAVLVAGYATKTALDANGNVLGTTDARGRTTAFAYDGLDRKVRQTLPAPGTLNAATNATPVTTWTYDQDDDVLTVTDALGNVTGGVAAEHRTTYTYDPLGRKRTETLTDPDGSGPLAAPVTTWSYDPAGNVTATTDAKSNVTTFVYDTLGRKTKQTQPDADGNSATANDSPVTTWGYDPNGNLMWTTTPRGNMPGVQPTGQALPAYYTTFNEYDKLNRKIKQTDADPDGSGSNTGSVTRYGYDEVGNLKWSIDPLGNAELGASPTEAAINTKVASNDNTTTYAYDALDRQTQQKLPDRNDNTADTTDRPVTAFTYNNAGHVLTRTDSDNNVTTYTYDALGRQKTDAMTIAAGTTATRTREYDAVGNLTRLTDRNGRVTEYAYDDLNRQQQEVWRNTAGGAVVRTINNDYDVVGRQLSVSDPDATYAYTYDNLGRVLSVDSNGTPNVPRSVLTYAYDPLGLLTDSKTLLYTTANPSGVQDVWTHYDYDALARTKAVVQQAGNVSGTPANTVQLKRVEYDYNNDSQAIAQRRYNNTTATGTPVTTTRTFDQVGRLVLMDHATGGTTITSYRGSSAAGTWITYDKKDRVTNLYNSRDGQELYTYDADDQLLTADHPAGTGQPADENYGYTNQGNRTNSGYATAYDNRTTADGTYGYQYDAEGNLTRKTVTLTGQANTNWYWEYAYDHRNRLTGVSYKNASGVLQNKTSFAYDALGGRLAKLYDANGNGTLTDAADKTERVVPNGGAPSLVLDGSQAVVNRYLYGPGPDEVLAEEIPANAGSEKLHWTLTDGQGSVRDTANAAGAFVAHTTLTAFGKPGTAISRFLYTGQEYDAQTALTYMNARYYDAATGKFVNQDPSGFDGGDSNLYRYVGNNAPNLTDPTGLRAVGDPIKFGDTFQQGLHRQWGMPLHGPRHSWLSGTFFDDVLGIDDGHVFGINTNTSLGALLNVGVTSLMSPSMAWDWDNYWQRMDGAVIRTATDPMAAIGYNASFGVDFGFWNVGVGYQDGQRSVYGGFFGAQARKTLSHGHVSTGFGAHYGFGLGPAHVGVDYMDGTFTASVSAGYEGFGVTASISYGVDGSWSGGLSAGYTFDDVPVTVGYGMNYSRGGLGLSGLNVGLNARGMTQGEKGSFSYAANEFYDRYFNPQLLPKKAPAASTVTTQPTKITPAQVAYADARAAELGMKGGWPFNAPVTIEEIARVKGALMDSSGNPIQLADGSDNGGLPYTPRTWGAYGSGMPDRKLNLFEVALPATAMAAGSDIPLRYVQENLQRKQILMKEAGIAAAATVPATVTALGVVATAQVGVAGVGMMYSAETLGQFVLGGTYTLWSGDQLQAIVRQEGTYGGAMLGKVLGNPLAGEIFYGVYPGVEALLSRPGRVLNANAASLNVLNPEFAPTQSTLNRVTAFGFYTEEASFSKALALQHMEGINFTKPVAIEMLTSGTTLQQYASPGLLGNYFSPIGTTPLQSGLAVTDQTLRIYQSSAAARALKSTAATDYIYRPGAVIPGSGAGGGTQYFVPNKSVFVPVKP